MEVNAEFVGKISCQVESLLIIVSNVLGRRLVFQADSNIQAEHYGIKFQPLTDFKRKKKIIYSCIYYCHHQILQHYGYDFNSYLVAA